MSWKGRLVVVTGAGGFIGSHLVEALVAEGARVRALVHYNAQGSIGSLVHVDRRVLDVVEIVAGDVRDPYAMGSLVRGAHTVFHLAALIGIPYSYVAPASYVATNIGGTLNLLEAVRAAKAERLVVASTSETYGTAQYTPIDEAHPAVAQSPYAATKVGADQLALSYHRSFNTPVCVVRPFNTFGPRQSERAVIPAIVTQAIRNEGSVRLGSLEPRRDLTYVTDTVRGFLVLAERSEALGRAVNLGTGTSHSVRELVDVVGRAVGRELGVVQDPARVRPELSEVMELCADNGLARSFGWSPRISLEQGVRDVVEFLGRRAPEPGAQATEYRI
jgi:NAD dependent epimerase/dehydratase